MKRFITIVVVFVILVVVVGVVTVRNTEETGFDWFGNREESQVPTEQDFRIEVPHLPSNVTREIFETTPSSVSSKAIDTPFVSEIPPKGPDPKKVLHVVPFVSQAPTGKWFDARFQDGCEEASVLMAMRWVQGKGLTAAEAEQEIIAMSEYELKSFGNFHDTSAYDTAEHIFNGYFGYSNVEVRYDIVADDIRSELKAGNLVIVPANGQWLGNPYYTPPGPDHHMILIVGYDPATNEFITNDPGTRRGKEYRYPFSTLESAVRDYPTGDHELVTEDRTAMIVVRK